MNKNKSITIIIILISSFLIIISSVYYITKKEEESKINKVLNQHLVKLKSHYDVISYNNEKIADSFFEETINKEKVLKLITSIKKSTKIEQTQIKKDIYTLLKSQYKRMTSLGMYQFNIILPNNEVFLQMHNIDIQNDSTTNDRDDYTLINKTKEIVRGFHKDKSSHGFKNLYPIFSTSNEYLGAIEISYNSIFLQDSLTNISKIHTHFLIHKDLFKDLEWNTDSLLITYKQSGENKDYLGSILTHHYTVVCGGPKHKYRIKPILANIDKKMKEGNAFFDYMTFEGRIGVVSLLPIKGTHENVVAWIVSYEEDFNISDIKKDIFYVQIVLTLTFLFLFLFIYKILNQRNILNNEVRIKTSQLDKINLQLEERVSEEVKKNNLIQEQLYKSEKLASMGEMIGNIAHQWRQPLSVITIGITAIKIEKELDILEDKHFYKICDLINNNAQYLSRTIDDFKNFIKGEKVRENFNIFDNINSFIHLIEGTAKNNNINIILDIDKNIQMESYPNELIQCYMNIFNNAKDILLEKNIETKLFFINVYEDEKKVSIELKDNAGGIKDDIITKIFEPYFTTKDKSMGTGLGLYMSYKLITKGMKGIIEVKNSEYIYNDKVYKGALFTLVIPKFEEENQ